MKDQGVRLSERYTRLLAAFGVWLGMGAALLLLGSGQWVLGIILSALTAVLIVVGIRGSRMSEKTFMRRDLRLQGLTLAIPVGFIGLLILLLGRFFTPLVGYAIGYYLVLLVIAALAGRELLSAEPAN